MSIFESEPCLGLLMLLTMRGVSLVLMYWLKPLAGWLEASAEGSFPTGLIRPVLRAIGPKRTA